MSKMHRSCEIVYQPWRGWRRPMYNESLFEKFNKPHRLHPVSIIVDYTKIIKETIFGFGIGLIITLKESLFYFILFAVLFLLVLLIYSVLSWLRFTYYVEGDELRIEQGVFIRRSEERRVGKECRSV